MSRVHAISISEKKGMRKTNVEKARLLNEFGIEHDAHAGKWHRQVSLLAQESIDKMVSLGLDVKSGDFAENITTIGVDLCTMTVGQRLKIGDVSMTISQIGKICHTRCAIYYQAGDCVMPKEGIFATVQGDGEIAVGDPIERLGKKGLAVGIITLSDRASQKVYDDLTGPAIEEQLNKELEISFIRREVIPDEKDRLEMVLVDFADTQKFDIIITNGSTGVGPRDIAPEVTERVLEKRLPGFEEAMRMESFKITPHALISRAVCGIRRGTVIVNLPGSPKGATENLAVILKALPHCVAKLQGDKSECAQ